MFAHWLLTAFLTVAVLDPRLEAISRAMVTNLATGRLEAVTAAFNDDFRQVATPEQLAAIKSQLDAEAGGFRGIKSLRESKEKGLTVVEVSANFEKTEVIFRVTFDFQGRVASVAASPYVPPKIDPALDDYAKAMFTAFESDRFDIFARRFDVAMRKQLSPLKAAELRDALKQQYGAFRSVTGAEQRVENDYRVVTVTADFVVAPVLMRVTFGRNGEVAGLWFGPKQ